MRRNVELRISDKVNELVKMVILTTHAEEGKKLTKAAMAERLILIGARQMSKAQGWEVPDEFGH